jgi:hypothetical protein
MLALMQALKRKPRARRWCARGFKFNRLCARQGWLQAALNVCFRLKNLHAAVFAALEVNVVRAAQFAGLFVSCIGWCLQRVG